MRSSRVTDRKSTRLNRSHTGIYPLSLPDALPIRPYRSRMTEHQALHIIVDRRGTQYDPAVVDAFVACYRSEEHTSEPQSHRYLPSFPTRRSSDPPLPEPDDGAPGAAHHRRPARHAVRPGGRGCVRRVL